MCLSLGYLHSHLGDAEPSTPEERYRALRRLHHGVAPSPRWTSWMKSIVAQSEEESCPTDRHLIVMCGVHSSPLETPEHPIQRPSSKSLISSTYPYVQQEAASGRKARPVAKYTPSLHARVRNTAMKIPIFVKPITEVLIREYSQYSHDN